MKKTDRGRQLIRETQIELEEQLDEYYAEAFAAGNQDEVDPAYLRALALTILKDDAAKGNTVSPDFAASLILFLCVQEEALRAEFEERIARIRSDAGLPAETDEDITLH